MYAYAQRVKYMQGSAVREILKVTEEPEVISFAGGLPAPELFPLQQLREGFARVLAGPDASSLQYSTTEGYVKLREYLAVQMSSEGINAGPENILITNGSQQALDLIAKLFLNPGDTVLVENPSYLGAIQTFRSYEANFVTLPSDEQGITTEGFAEIITRFRPKLIYVSPNFRNPTGLTMSLTRRKSLAELSNRFRVPVIEDNPYGALRYSGEHLPAVKSFDRRETVLYLSTFSKTVAPGLRLGWVVAPPELMAKLVLAKQGTDLHTSTLAQRALYYYLTHNCVESHISSLRKEYAQRLALMLREMAAYFPSQASWTRPNGGMFIWVTLPDKVDATQLLQEAVREKIAFVPGSPFFANGGGENTLRLNFSNSTPEQISTGIERLGRLLDTKLNPKLED